MSVKVGDKIRIINAMPFEPYKDGDIFTVENIACDYNYVKVRGIFSPIRRDEFEIITNEEDGNMTKEKAQVGDLIRVIEADGYSDVPYEEGDIIEIVSVYGRGDKSDDHVCYEGKGGELLHDYEFVIHRKAGEEDIDGDVGACASCGAEVVFGEPGTAATLKYDTSYDATDEQIRMAIELGEQDAVNQPSHYTQGKFETIEIIEHLTSKYDDGFTAHCVGTAFKYMDRAPYKHDTPTECLRKAAKYLEFAIERLDAKSTQK